MILRALALAAMAATSIGSQAALTTYAPWQAYWPQGVAPNQTGVGIDNVQFNVVTANGVTVAMGAHGYKNGETLPNDGVSTYSAMSGTYPGEPDRANWSFDFAWDMSACTACTLTLKIDTDPSAAVNLVALPSNPATPSVGFISWNMEMPFLAPLLGGYNFNPFAPSSTAFTLEISRGIDVLASSSVTVNVPEPGSLALAGIALAGLAGLRRRKV